MCVSFIFAPKPSSLFMISRFHFIFSSQSIRHLFHTLKNRVNVNRFKIGNYFNNNPMDYFFFLAIIGCGERACTSYTVHLQCIVGVFNLLAYFRYNGCTAFCRKIFQGIWWKFCLPLNLITFYPTIAATIL